MYILKVTTNTWWFRTSLFHTLITNAAHKHVCSDHADSSDMICTK